MTESQPCLPKQQAVAAEGQRPHRESADVLLEDRTGVDEGLNFSSDTFHSPNCVMNLKS